VVTFDGAMVFETQMAMRGVTSMLGGEKVVFVDLAEVWTDDEHGLDALRSLFDAPTTSV